MSGDAEGQGEEEKVRGDAAGLAVADAAQQHHQPAVFFAIVVLLLLAVPGLRTAAEKITDAEPGWIARAIGFELLSCVGYMVLFDLVFGRIGRSLVTRLSLSELAVNSVVSVSGLAGLALGAWVLRERGFSVERIAKRTVLIFVLTSAVSAAAVVVIGVPMWLGILPGSTNPLLTLLPACIAAAAIGATIAAGRRAGRRAEQLGEKSSRSAIALVAVTAGSRTRCASSAAATGVCSAPSATGCSTC